MLLIFRRTNRRVAAMRVFLVTMFLVAITALAAPAQAGCFAVYKAKRDKPLKLHYGVMQLDISPCTMSAGVKRTVALRLMAAGWTLLQVQSVFDDSGLESKKRDAGQYFLRF